MSESKTKEMPKRPFALWAGLVSYLIPGLGQVLQGRIIKGMVFFFCLYGLFFYGLALGQYKNVYLPDTTLVIREQPLKMPALFTNIYNRLHFAGQFWIGIAAWPALWHYNYPDDDGKGFFGSFMKTPPEEELNRMQRETDKTWDLAWVYTVIAGVLNILVIYDAIAGPAFAEAERKARLAMAVEVAT